MTTLRSLSIMAVIVTYALIVLGALVRTTGSGLSCPDWPTCYGSWIPTPANVAAHTQLGFTYTQVMLEWVHRFIAGIILGPMILAIVLVAWIGRHERSLKRASIALLGLLIVQGALGGLTVLDANSPWSVAVHLSNALVLLLVLLFIASRVALPSIPAVGRKFRILTVVSVPIAIATMAAAAMTAKSGASLACATWPLCNGQWFPNLEDPLVAVHSAHRFLAALLTLTVLALAIRALKEPLFLRWLSWATFGLIAFQVSVGAGLIVWLIPMPLAVFHQAVAVLLFVMLSVLLWAALLRSNTARSHSIETERPLARQSNTLPTQAAV